jgi:hypothetical protein
MIFFNRYSLITLDNTKKHNEKVDARTVSCFTPSQAKAQGTILQDQEREY